MKNISTEIKRLRIEAGFSADKFAEMLGREGNNRKQYVYDIESGKNKKIDVILMKKICDIFKISPDFFYEYIKPEDLDYYKTVEEMPILYNSNIDSETKINYIKRELSKLSAKNSSFEEIIFAQEERIINLEKKIKALVTLLEVEKAMSDLLIRTKTDGS